MSGLNSFLDNDQRTSKGEFIAPIFKRKEKRVPNLEDPKNEGKLDNILNRAEQRGMNERKRQLRGERVDPTQPARDHGHEPSKGAKIDRELYEDERAYLEKKKN
ncbi:hypothetical protein BU17DRAFT_61945 [Hysterangium stoloniferum]|nr:hypothetical protein BU17DRAFT_61945 [Hysterangium stoloniferum]